MLYAGSLKLSLVVASFGESNPVIAPFAILKTLNVSAPEPDASERWSPKPEIEHTFRAPQELPNKGLTGLFALAVVTGLPVFLILVLHTRISAINSSFSLRPPM